MRLHTLQNGHGLVDGGLIDFHRLEAALQCRILLNVLTILVDGSRTNDLQIPWKQRDVQSIPETPWPHWALMQRAES